MTRTSWGSKGFISCSTSGNRSINEITQGRKLEAGPQAEAMEEQCSLACSACFLTQSRTASPEMTLPTVD